MQLPRDVAGSGRHVFPLKSYQACGAVKLGKVELNSTFRHLGHRATGHPRCRSRMFPLKIELPPVCPSATTGSAYGSYGVATVIWKPGLNEGWACVSCLRRFVLFLPGKCRKQLRSYRDRSLTSIGSFWSAETFEISGEEMASDDSRIQSRRFRDDLIF